jgi:type I restriction enzyme, S subunit
VSRRERFAFIRSQNVFDRYFSSSGLAFISDEQARGLRGVELQPGDILLNITGDGITFGRCCSAPLSVLPACVNQHVSIVRVNPVLADADFILSYLTHPLIKRYMESFNTGGSRRAITKTHIESFLLPLPPLADQQRIGKMLALFDDRIQQLFDANGTLEAMARAVFKSWFVDFGPVRAKAEGREPEGMDAATAALFPSGFAEAEHDEIPQGWVKAYIGDCAEIVGGSTPSTANADFWKDGEYCWATPKDLSSLKSPVLLGTDRKITEEGLATISSGLLPVGTVLLSSRNPIGYIALAEVSTAINQGLIAMKPKGRMSNLFLSLWTESALETIKSFANGSIFQEISKRNFRTIRLVRPAEPVLGAFDGLVRPMVQRIALQERRIQTLSDLRDTLLPRLISGKLRLPDAEKLALATL